MANLKFGFGKKLPVILQTEASECGLACLAMIASYHQHQTDLPEMRKRFAISLKGATLEHLIDIADQLGLVSRPLRIGMGHLSQLNLPAMLHWNLNHFVVLKAVGCTDPAGQQGAIKVNAFASADDGLAIQRQMIGEPRHQNVREQARTGDTALNGAAWCWRLDDGVTASPCQLWATLNSIRTTRLLSHTTPPLRRGRIHCGGGTE